MRVEKLRVTKRRRSRRISISRKNVIYISGSHRRWFRLAYMLNRPIEVALWLGSNSIYGKFARIANSSTYGLNNG